MKRGKRRGEERREENGGLDEGIISSSRVTGYYDNMTLYVTVTVSVRRTDARGSAASSPRAAHAS